MSNPAVANATALYFSAQFGNCIDACQRITARDRSAETRSEVTLLTARSMLRLARYVEAEDVLTSLKGHTTPDAQLTSSILLAMARISRGMTDDGLHLLQTAGALEQHAHPSIHSELELYKAYAYFAKRDMHSALRHISRVRVDSDIIHARALQVQGFCHSWLGRKRDAGASYAAALSRLDKCRYRDYVVAAAAIAGLSVIAYELNDSALMRLVEQRYTAMRWPTGTASYRHEVETNLALLADFTGQSTKAAAFASMALQTGQGNAALQAGSFSHLARIANHARDHFTARAYLDSAWRLVDSLDDCEIQGTAEGSWAMLEVVRETALYDVLRARTLFARYKTLRSSPLSIYSGSLQDMAEILLVEGLMLQGEGSIALARESFRKAHEAYRICEFDAEAVESAHWLAILGDENMHWYVSGSLAGVKNWMTEIHTIKLG